MVKIQHVSYAYEAFPSPPVKSTAAAAASAKKLGKGITAHNGAQTKVALKDPTDLDTVEKWALRDVSLSIEAGTKIAILGANGSGKSTLARLIAGLEAPDKGTVKLFGKICKNEAGLQSEAYADARKKTAMVFQEAADQILGLSVAEDIAFGPENLRFSQERIQKIVAREVDRFGLSGLEDMNPQALSGGQQQKLVLASALAMEPELLVLDEAGAHLDVVARRHLYDVLFQYAGTLVYITHDLEDALLADRILVLKQGSLVAEGAPQAIFVSPEEIASWNIAMPPQLVLQQELQKRGVTVPFTLDEKLLCQRLKSNYSLHEIVPADSNSVQQKEMQGHLIETEPCSSEAISIRHLSFAYEQTPILEDVSLSIPKGKTCALIGETGTGKTTLLRILAGLLTQFEGEVSCDGVTPVEYTRFLNRRHRNRNLSRHVGYVIQAPERQLFAQTVLEDVSYGPRNLGLSLEEAQAQARSTLEALGIAHLGQASPFELSGGEARLVAIAGIAAMNAPLLLMDEPFAGLDARASEALKGFFSSLAEQRHTLLFTTHDMNEAAQASHIALLAKKRIQVYAHPRDFFANTSILREFRVALPWALWFSRELNLPETCFPASIPALADEIAGTYNSKRQESVTQ